ncbi:MAG: 30S ribosomal protein S6 [Candidatus Omnitrophota bacterium]|nr:MAG: 30S ribosomal protein S6 [Candidatus Omnitrophota bacterium]
MKGVKMHRYEGMLILKPHLGKEREEEISRKIEKLITQEGGKIKNFQPWGERKLAYRIGKENRGVYFLFHFLLSPQSVEKIKRACQLEEDILRILIVRMK